MTDSNRGKDGRAESDTTFRLALLAVLAILGTALQGVWTLAVLQTDADNICAAPELALAVTAGAAFPLSCSAFVFALMGRSGRAAVALLAAVVASGVWLALGGPDASACVIGA